MCDACTMVGNGVTIIHTAFPLSQHRHWTSKVVSITRVGQLLVRGVRLVLVLRLPSCSAPRQVRAEEERLELEATERHRRQLISEERARLLGEHAPGLLGYLPKVRGRHAASRGRHTGNTQETCSNGLLAYYYTCSYLHSVTL